MDNFISEITISDVAGGGLTRTLPVAGFTIESVPYSRSGQIATELFDGRMRPNFDGFRHRIQIDWGMLRRSEMDDLRSLVLRSVEADDVEYRLIDPPLTEGGNQLSFILQNASRAVREVFSRNIRNTPASVSFVSREITQQPIDLA